MRVAVLGLGHMGRAVALRLCQAGHEVAVWNRSPGKANELVAHGAHETRTVAEAVRGVEVALSVLSDDAAVKQVYLGAGGAIAALAADAVLVDMSTVHPDTSRAMATGPAAGRFMAAPVLARPQALAAGRALLLIGGPEEAVHRLDRFWHDLAAAYLYTGPPGSASTLKLLSNLILVGSTNLLRGRVTEAVTGRKVA